MLAYAAALLTFPDKAQGKRSGYVPTTSLGGVLCTGMAAYLSWLTGLLRSALDCLCGGLTWGIVCRVDTLSSRRGLRVLERWEGRASAWQPVVLLHFDSAVLWIFSRLPVLPRWARDYFARVYRSLLMEMTSPFCKMYCILCRYCVCEVCVFCVWGRISMWTFLIAEFLVHWLTATSKTTIRSRACAYKHSIQ